MTEPTDDTLRRWLLQRLPPHEAEPLEQRLLADADLGERLREAETDLLDDLVRGHLGEAERVAATRRFAATARDRMRLRMAAALAHVTRTRSPSHRRHAGAGKRGDGSLRRRRFVALGALAAACAVVVAVIGLRLRPDAGTAEATITLMASQQRGAASGIEIAIPQGVASVRLQAEVDSADANVRYAVRIEGAAAPFIARDIAVHEAGPYRFVEVDVPVSALAAGEHRVRVVAEGGEGSELWEIRTRDE